MVACKDVSIKVTCILCILIAQNFLKNDFDINWSNRVLPTFNGCRCKYDLGEQCDCSASLNSCSLDC